MHEIWNKKKSQFPSDLIGEARRFVLMDATTTVTPTVAAGRTGKEILIVDLSPIGIGFLMALRAEDGNGQIISRFLHQNLPNCALTS